jgi:chromosome segregation ATPase
MGYAMKGFGGFGNSPVKQKKEIDFKKTNNYKTTTEQDRKAGDKRINDPEGKYSSLEEKLHNWSVDVKELEDEIKGTTNKYAIPTLEAKLATLNKNKPK